jgi:hypothetical protein
MIMTTKLTLTMDDAIIRRAEEYAKTRNTNISAMVENWLDRISVNDRSFNVSEIHSSLVDSMCGIICDSGRDYRELLDEALTERLAKSEMKID